MFNKTEQINDWKNQLRKSGKLSDDNIEELESHLLDEIEELTLKGLAEDEAFFIAIKRLGSNNALISEYALVNKEKVWKQFFANNDYAGTEPSNKNLIWAIVYSLSAALLSQIPWFAKAINITINQDAFYAQFFPFIFIVPLMRLMAVFSNQSLKRTFLKFLPVIALFILRLIYPFNEYSDTGVLSFIHLPMLVWLLASVMYRDKSWFSTSKMMDFIRFSGELFIYTVLLIAGIMVVSGLTAMIFDAIGIRIVDFIMEHIALSLIFAAPVFSAYLVEEKSNVIENMAPVLAKVFSPLLLIVLIVFMGASFIPQKSILNEREFLIILDLILVLVLAMVLFSLSARNKLELHNKFDYVNFALIVVALIVDITAMTAIIDRLISGGVTPNKIAALGENVLLIINLGGLAYFYFRYFIKRKRFDVIEHAQTRFLAVYSVWFFFIAFILPLLFQFA